MSLDIDHAPTPDDLIRYGEGEAVRKLEEIARAEEARGDGRAMRQLARLIEAAGLGLRKTGRTP